MPLAARFGPFTEMLGAEREFAGAAARVAGPARIWCHPTHDTVGSVLRLIGSRLTGDVATCPRGIVIVPFAPDAGWWSLLRHFSCVGEYESKVNMLEAATVGGWSAAYTRRPSLVMFFPRAGARLAPLRAAVQTGSYVAEAGKDKWAITLQMASTRAADDEPPEGKVAAQHALIWHAQ